MTMSDNDKSIIETAKERYEKAKQYNQTARQLSIEDTKFALGDSENGWQWDEGDRRQRIIERRACLTVNLTAQHCNQVINNIRQNRPQCRVLPSDDVADKKTAEIMAGLIRSIQSNSNSDDAHDIAAEHAIYGGEGYWRIITEYEDESSFNQVIKIKAISDPNMVYIDPFCREPDKSDAEWGFVFEDISKEQCKRMFPKVDPESWVEDSRGWVTKETVRLAEYFYCDYLDDTALLLADGSTVLKSEVQDGMPLQVINKRATKKKQWRWCKLLGGQDEPVEKQDWAGRYLPIISIVGKEMLVNGDLVRKGLVRDLKDPARMVNYSYSAAVETIALQNKVPYIAAVESIENFESIWKNANNENRAFLPFNAFDESGQPIPKPERQQPAVMPTAQIQMLSLSTEQMRGASGQQNANFGIKSDAQSGIGIQRLKMQGETATFHFPDNLARGLRYEGKVLIDLIPKVMTARQMVRVLGLDGKEDYAHLDPSMQQAYAEVPVEDDVQKVFNPSVGRYDVVIDVGPTFETQRQEAFASMMDLAGKDPKLMSIAGDIIMRAADFPMADQLAKRFEQMLPPQLQDKKGAQQIPPQAQQHIQQLTQMIQQLDHTVQQMQEENEQMKFDLKAKVIETRGKIEEAKVNQESELARAMADVEIAKANAIDPSRLDAAEQILAQLMLQVQAQQEQAAPPNPPEYMEPPEPPQPVGQPPEQPLESGFFTPEPNQQ